MIDDKDQSLLELSQQYRASIVSQLVEIGSERNQQKHSKLRYFVNNLECLWQRNTRLYRKSINASSMPHYVALSYTWKGLEDENKRSKKYCIQSWSGNRFRRSKVRNCVFDRIFHYMRHTNVRFLWIDRYCVRQDTCKVAPCAHSHCAQNRQNIQAMDLVYKLSRHPVALLDWSLGTRDELQLFTRILSGDLGDRATDLCEMTEALRLLHKITKDRWWERAWTFQENYRGGEQMRLLIRHNPLLERQKLQYTMYGKIPGELCVESVRFSIQATWLCLKLEKADKQLSQEDTSRINSVLQATGRYNLILDESSAMTPRIIADIEARGMEQPSDRLAIVANCCQYSMRLDYNALSRQDYSLSLSILAMCLLNGEILNGNDSMPVGHLTMSEFLKRQMFRKFKAPKRDRRKQTYYKGCRLTDVELTATGIATKGHLWKLGLIIDTAKFTQNLPRTDDASGGLLAKQRKALLQLVFYLREMGHHPYADRINKSLHVGARARNNYALSTKNHMAIELANAIEAGQNLRLGKIWDPAGSSTLGYAVFVWSDKDSDGANPSPPAFVFTSAWAREPDSEAHDTNDINRHVSLRVDLEDPLGGGVPHLRACSWLLGICFFDGCPRTRVIFPWPQVLQDIQG